jgi:hypothetical protein
VGLVIGLNILLALLGYLLPVPGVILIWREWLKNRRVPQVKVWRRTMSQIGLSLVSLGLALWIYAIVREAWYHDYSYIVPSAVVGRWGSLVLIIDCAFAESKLRRYLLRRALGLLFFFGCSIGDVTI